MGRAPGPVPKRSEERIRRNKPVIPITKVQAAGRVEQPELGFPDVHPMIQDFWDSLGESAQAKYYEPSDWQFARFTLHFANQLVNSGRPSAQLLTTVNSALTDLLVTEGARRRVQIEVEREQQKNNVADVAELFKQRLTGT